MDDPITVALKVVAVRMRWLGMAASAGVFYAHRIVGEHEQSLAANPELLRREGLPRCARLGRARAPVPRQTHNFTTTYYFAPSSLASFILAESSFFCTLIGSAGSTSAAMVRFHSVSARSQLVAASFRRPVFW